MSHHPESETLHWLFGQVCRLHRARIHDSFESLGLYRGQPPVLYALWEQEGMTHTELCKRLGVQPSTITKMIKRMEKVGFVERRSDPSDQRLSRVYLTDRGRAVQNEVNQVWGRIESETFEGFTVEEQVLLRRFFMHMRDNLARFADGEHHRR